MAKTPTIKETYIEGLDMKQFKVITEISCYNHNYHVGAKRNESYQNDLLLSISDDDNETEWFIATSLGFTPIGYSYCSQNDLLHTL